MTTRAAQRAIWLILLGAGLVGGWHGDRASVRERPPQYRAGLRVLEVDFHAHTRFSDGLLSPFELVIAARRRGLDAIAVTEHNNVFPAQMAAWFSRRIDGPTVVVGEEITTKHYHLIGVGVHERVEPRADATLVVEEIHRQGGIAIAAHPVRRFWPAFEPVFEDLDAAEVVHPIALRKRDHEDEGGHDRRWSWDEMVTFYNRPRKRRLTAIGSSDYHGYKVLGLCRTLVFADDDSAEAIIVALREGRTVVRAPDGQSFGDPALIESLEREPLLRRGSDVGYAPSDRLDAITRVLGWMGLLGLLLFRVTPRRRGRRTG